MSKFIRISVILFIWCAYPLWAQTNYKLTGTPNFTIAGTSTMHDWTMASAQAVCEAQLETDATGKLVKINSVTLTLKAESLKSGKSAMDKNAYKSLKTDKYKDIRFQLTSASVQGESITAKGTLTIAGSSKPAEITLTGKSSGNGIRFQGSKDLKMSEFGVEPPSFMFGSVKTGNDIKITFDITLSK